MAGAVVGCRAMAGAVGIEPHDARSGRAQPIDAAADWVTSTGARHPPA